MASNSETMADQDGEFEDWIELYNNGSASIDLEGYYLSDNINNLTKWEFPRRYSYSGGWLCNHMGRRRWDARRLTC